MARVAAILLIASALALLSGQATRAAVISVTNYQGVGATLGLDPSKTYTHKLDFPGDGSSAPVNGVQLSAVPFGFGTDPLTGRAYSLTMASPANWPGSAQSSVIYDFSYNTGQSAGARETVTLGGLTVGTRYDARFYYDGTWPGRPQTVTISTGGSLWTGTLDQPSGYPQNYWSIVFQADTPTLAVSFSQNTAGSWHQHAITNEVVPATRLGEPRYPITDLFNTGVVTDDNAGLNATLAAIASGDPHWTFVSGPQSPPTNPQATVQTNHSAWTANGPHSGWIGVTNSGANNVATGTYRYRTTFTIPANYDPATAFITGIWFTDNEDANTRIFLNGVDTLISGGGPFNAGYVFSLFHNVNNSGATFQLGTNTLDFQVVNAGTSPNPHGLRVDQLTGTVQLIPEPASFALLALGALGLLRRRHGS